jgi:hypothetical protein
MFSSKSTLLGYAVCSILGYDSTFLIKQAPIFTSTEGQKDPRLVSP